MRRMGGINMDYLSGEPQSLYWIVILVIFTTKLGDPTK